jgi:hypothetical protein
MKKFVLITLLTITTMGIVSQPALFVKTAEAFMGPAANNRAVLAAQLPSNFIIPENLPANIQGPMLLEPWVRLYNHLEHIALWDKNTLTGRQLAEYALDHALPIVWDAGRICAGGSCSLRYCDDALCQFDDRLHPGIKPIYIAPIAQPDATSMQFLVGSLAHEIFHRTSPFGAVTDTKFEDCWAFRIGSAIGKNAAPNFDNIDPLTSGELFIWLLKNRMSFYYLLPEYPASVAGLVSGH